MNKIFKIVFNKETGVFTAVAEFAKAQGKSSSCTVGSKSSRFVAQSFTLTALAAGMMLSSSVWAYSSMNGRVLAGDNDKTLAMMDNAVVQASEGIAIGNSATSYSNASGQSAQNVAIGHEAKAITGGVAIGYQANTLNSSQQKGTNQQSVAIGYQTVASGDQSTALGAQSKAAGNSSVAIGGDDLDKVASSRPPAWDDQTFTAEEAKGLNNTAAAKKYEQLTGDILVHFENSLVRGNQVTKTAGMPNRYTGTEAGEGSVAVGVQSQAKGSLATAFGTRTSASGTASVALGVGALATNDGSFAGAAGAQSTGVSSIALGTGSKAQGNQSLAMGDSAQATADNAYAIGTDAKATEVGAIAQGLTANASAVSAISIGRETNATKENAVALSRLANATGEAANAIGFRSEAHGTNSVALGTQTVATAGATAAVAIGEQANASNTKSIAIGAASKSSGDKSIAVGDSANATNTHSFAMGGQSLSTGTNAVAVGSNTKATGNFSTAISNNANASAHQALAVGVDSVSSKTYATAIGSSAKATGTGSYAGGREANATADYAIAVGNKASSAANGSIAIGNESSVISTGTNSVALGYKASATQQSSTSLGREATTASNYSTAVGANANVGENLIGAVALGTFSTAQAGVSTNEATVNGITYSGFAGNSILHRSGTESYVVSVGDANTKRQIQNVAAGQITKTSTDAINGSQLYMVADEVAKSREKVTSDDKTVTVKESKDSSSSTVFDLSINKSKLQVRQPADDFVYPDAVVVEAATGKVFAPNEEPAPTFVTADVLANTVANSGFRVAGNGTATEEVVNPGDTVNFVDGNGTKATASVVDGKNTVKYDVKVDNNTIKVGTDGNLTVNTDALPKAETPKNYFHTNATGQVQTGNDTNLDNVDGIGGAKGVNALAAGINAQANKQGDMAIGTGAVADGFDTNPDATNSGSAMAIGTNAKANGFVSMALGEESNATKNGALAVGSKAKATEGSAVALGRGAVSSGESATALGASSTAAAKFSIASGVQSQAVGIQSIALGRASVSGSQTATDTIAIGSSSKATETNGIAIGTSTVVSVVDGVALGSKSVASTDKGIVGANPLDANKDESPAWKSTAAAVSVGDVGNGITRQITSVAAGTEDTDAVNVAQLKAVANAARTKVVEGDNIDVSESKNDDGSITYTVATKKDLVVDSVKAGDTTINNDGLKVGDVTVTNSPITVNGDTVNNINEAINKTAEQAFKPLTFGGDTGTDVTRKLGEKVNVKGGATGELSSGNIAVEADGTDTLNIKLAKELKDINSITINNGPTINNNGINMDGDKITNLKDGEDDGDAVNVKQLKESKETVISKDNSIKVTTGKNANGANEFDLSVNKTELKDENNDGKVDAPSNEDGDKLVDAKTVADAINNSGFKLTTSASAGEVSGTTEELINPGDIVTIDAGNNIKVTQAAGKITVETKDNVTFGEKGEDGKPGKDGSVGVNGKDGSAVTLNGKDGSIGLNGKDGKDGLTFKSEAGPQGVNGDKGENGLPGKDGTTRIVYQPTNPDGTPNGEPEQVATLNDGLIFTGNNEALNRHKLNTVVKIVGDGVDKAASDSFKSAVGNINVVADKNDTLTIQLNKDLKDIDSITVNNGPTINGDGINMNGDTITNLGDGKEDGDAVNVKQMKASRTTVTSSDNSISVVDTNNGEGDNFAYDIKVNNQAVVENAQTPVVYTNKDGDKVYKQPDGTFNTKPDGTGNNVKPADVIASMNSGDNSTNNPTTLANVKSNLAPVTPADKSQPAANNPADLADKLNNAATVGDVLNAGWNLQGNGKAVDTVVHNDTVNFVNGVGTTARVETTDGKTSTVTYDVNVDNKTITTEEIDDPNNPGNKITQIKANTTELKDENKDGKVDAPSNEDGDKLVNAKNVADAINSSGFNLKTSATDGEKLSGDDELINPGDSVEMIAGKNLTVKQEANGKVTYATKDDIVLGEKGKDGKPGKDGSVGVNGKDGSGVSLNGKDGSIGLNGKDGKDGLTFKSEAGPQGVNGDKGENGLPGKDGLTRIVYQPTNPDGTPNGDPEQVATLNDGLIFTGNNELLNRHKLNTVVKIVGDGVNKAASDSFKSAVGNINVKADENDTLTIQLNKDLKDIDSITVNNGPTINGDGINMNGDTITNLGDGKEDGDAVNVKQMKASRTTVTSSDNSINVVDTNNGKGDNFAYDIKVNNQAVVENAQTPVVYTNKDGDKVYKQPDGTFNTKPDGTGDKVNPADVIASMNSGDNSTNNPTTLANVKSNLAPVTPADKSQPAANNPTNFTANQLNNAATLGDVLNAGWNLQGNGKAVDTVVHNDTVNFVNGVGTTAKVETTDGKTSTVTYDVNVDNKTITTEEVADPNNPGNKITQIKANTTELKDENKDGKVDAPSNEDGDKLVNAKNVADAINSSGFNLKTSATEGEKLSGDDELINPGDSVEMIAGKNLTVKQEANGKVTYATKDDIVLGEKGKDGKPGKDGSVGVNGKDGSGVSLNGKDGSIGLNGKDGKDGLTFKSEAGPQGVNGDKGENGLPGKDGTTRIVYQPTNPDGTPNGEPEQVATLNDGLIFTGNNEALNRHKLNTVVKIVGDGVDKAASDSFKSAVGNINVVADKNDTLTIQLNKDLKDIDSITVNNGPTINGDGINMNGDTITNLGDGKDDGDAVNVKQMKASRTTVTSSDNSINVVDTNNGKGDNFAYDIKVNNQAVVENAQTPVVYTNKDGDKVYKQPDGTFNTKPDGTGNNVKPADVIASMNSGDNSTNNPTTLANVKSNLAPVTPADKSQPAANNPTNFTANQLNNAATLGDVLNAGWNLQGNGKAVDTVVHNDTVNFVNGVGTTAKVETTDGKTSTVTYDVNVDNKTITTEEVADPNNPGNKITQIKANTTELKDENKDGKVDAPSNEDGDKLVNAKNVADAINSSGFNLKTSATDGEKLSGDDELINPGDSVEMIAGKNLTVKQEANGKVTYATKDDVQFNSVTSNKVIVGDAADPAKSSTLTSGDNGLDVGGDKITNVADGDISPVSTDVINGKQLNNYTKVNGNNIGTDQDGSINIVNGNGTTVTSDKAGEIKVNVNNTDLTVAEEGTINVQDPNGTGAHYVNANTVAKAVNEVSWSVNSETDKATANAATQNTYKPVDNKVKAGSQVKVNAGRNVEISGSGRNINVAVSDNPEFNSVKVGGTKLSSKVAEDGVNELNIGGNNNAPTRITNVAAGVKNTDAVNVSQLKGAVNNLDNKINRNNRDLRAGIAGANAAAGLPQVYIPGKSMVAAAAGTFKGENALAVGYSRSSDNGKVILKLQGNANTRGDLGGSVGVGYQW